VSAGLVVDKDRLPRSDDIPAPAGGPGVAVSPGGVPIRMRIVWSDTQPDRTTSRGRALRRYQGKAGAKERPAAVIVGHVVLSLDD